MGAGASVADQLRAELGELAKTNADGKVTLDELKSAHQRLEGDATDTRMLMMTFDALDAEGEGRISAREYLLKRGFATGEAEMDKALASAGRRANRRTSAVGTEDEAAAAVAAMEAAENRRRSAVGTEQEAAAACASTEAESDPNAAPAAEPGEVEMGQAMRASGARAHREGRRASAVGTEEDAAAAIAALEAQVEERRASAVGTEDDAAAACAAAEGAAEDPDANMAVPLEAGEQERGLAMRASGARAHREGRRASAVGTEEDAAAAIAALEAAQVDDAAQSEATASANAEATSS